jgi:hypothetical protein
MPSRTAPSLTFLNRMGCVFAAAIALGLTAFAQITPSQDAYTNTATPTTNFGAKTLLDVQSATQNTYIQFDLSSLPAGYTGANIAKATLKLYVNTVTSSGSFNVDFVNGSWDEKTITANLLPALGTTVVPSVPLSSSNVKDYVLIDITPALQAWLNGTQPNDGIALVGNSPLNATFDSKESTTQSHPPELDVVFTSSGGGGITGINTANGSGLIGGGNSGTLNLSLTNACAANQVLKWSGSAWSCTNLTGSGTVTSVGLSAPISDFTVTGSPITTAGTLGLNWTVSPTSSNIANAIVKRDSTGSFSAANLSATGSLSTQGNILINRSDTSGFGVRLDVQNTANTGLSVFAGVAGTANGVTTEMFADGQGGGPLHKPSGLIGTYTNHPLALMTNLIPHLYVDTSGAVGIQTSAPQAELNVNQGFSLNTFLVGSTSKGIQLRDTGTGADFETFGVPLYVNYATHNDVYLNPNGGRLYIGTLGDVNLQNPPPLMNVGAFPDGIGNFTSASFSNDVYVFGNFYAQGSKNFRIPHPLDPDNKYLIHAAIESSEVLNMYTGNARLNDRGEADVQFPAWFSAINIDFRYQLTAVGAAGPDLYVAKEIENGAFRIAGGTPGMKVSWQVTCLRNDPYMKAHPMVVEEEKPASELGYYRYPEFYGQPPEKAIGSIKPATAGKEVPEPTAP